METPQHILVPLDVAQNLVNYLSRCIWKDVDSFIHVLLNAQAGVPAATATPAPPALRAVPGRAHDLMSEDV